MSRRRRSRGKRQSRISKWRSELDDAVEDRDAAIATDAAAETEAARSHDAIASTPRLGVPALAPAVGATLASALEVRPPILPVSTGAPVEPIADTSEALTRPTELVPTASELALMALVETAPVPEPAPLHSPSTTPPRPPPGAPLLVVHIPPKPARAAIVEAAPARERIATPSAPRPRFAAVSAALGFAGILVAIASIVWARGEVERARQAAAPAAPAVVASAVPLATTPVPPELTWNPPPEPVPPSTQPEPVVPSPAQPEPVVAAAAPVEAAVEPPPRPARERRQKREERARPRTAVTISSNPPGVGVFVKGRRIGTTPFVANVDRDRETTLWFRANGVQADWRRILPRTPSAAVHVTLQPAAVVAR